MGIPVRVLPPVDEPDKPMQVLPPRTVLERKTPPAATGKRY